MNLFEQKLLNSFGSYKDFPKPGIVFCDILPILRDKNLFNDLIKNMSSADSIKNSEAIVAIDARGFIFGTAISLETKKPLICARKPGKLPGELISSTYKLEYGENSLSMQINSLRNFNTFAIIDDLLATGGTVKCVSDILTSRNKEIKGLSVVVELQDLNGRSKFDFPVDSQIKF